MKSLLTTLLLITGISIAQPPPGTFLPPSYPQTISFQAMMTDTLGNPVADGTHNFTFRISSPAQGGAEIFWEETKQVDVVDGVVSTILGSVTPIEFLPFRDDLHLDVALDNELISVNPLTSVPFALMSSRAMRAYNATHADTANFTHQAGHAMHADTANFVMNVPMSDTSHFAHQAGHAEHADTSNFTHQANHSEHADTANYINLSNYNGSISVVKDDDAEVTIYSTDDNSSSFLTLISQTSAGVQRELRVINEGDIGGGFRFYDSSNEVDLMVLDTTGTLTATKFVGDGSQLTGLSTSVTSINDLSDALVENSSIYLGSDPSGTTVGAQFNVAVGVYALDDIIYGDSNIAIGVSALTNNTTGSYNNAVGSAALGTNTTGGWNTANGYNSLVLNTTGSNNTGIGAFALGYNTTGSANAAIGMKSLRGNTTGTRNIAF